MVKLQESRDKMYAALFELYDSRKEFMEHLFEVDEAPMDRAIKGDGFFGYYGKMLKSYMTAPDEQRAEGNFFDAILKYSDLRKQSACPPSYVFDAMVDEVSAIVGKFFQEQGVSADDIRSIKSHVDFNGDPMFDEKASLWSIQRSGDLVVGEEIFNKVFAFELQR